MRRYGFLFTVALSGALSLGLGGVAVARLLGPGWGITGNDTGGIIPYSPYIEDQYQDMAAGHCARWHRLSHITSVHRRYGDYIGFVCIDKPWMIH
jgi:hypothetical protein